MKNDISRALRAVNCDGAPDRASDAHARIQKLSQFVQVLSKLVDKQIQPAVEILQHPEFDHAAFLEFITHGKLRNFVCGVLGKAAVKAALPEKHTDILLEHWWYENIRKLALWDEQNRLVEHFDKSGMPLVVLKGNVLGDLLYQDLRHRHQTDLDLLVRRADLNNCIALFHDLGFVLARDRNKVTANQLRTEHAVGMVREKIKIDLHWCLRTAPAYSLDDEKIWQSCKRVQIDGHIVNTVSNEWALVLLLISFVHDVSRGAGRLKHAIDICLLVRKCAHDIDWDLFLQARQRDQTLRTCLNGLALVSELMGPGAFPLRVHTKLLAYRSLLRVHGQGHCLFLLDQPRRSIQNAIWFCGVYPVNLWRDASYALDRNLTRPARVPLLLSRVARRTWQVLNYSAKSLLTRDLPYPMINQFSGVELTDSDQPDYLRAA